MTCASSSGENCNSHQGDLALLALPEPFSSDLASPCFWLLQLRVFKTNPEGVVSVRFREAEPAQQCVQLMNGR